jgi:RHS repeat-associated protein
VALTDGTPAVTVSYTYEAFGTTAVNGATGNGYDYTGREADGTGLKAYRARYYHPSFQRFISEDPVRFDGGDLNLYTYAGNAPLDFVDPTGKSLLSGAFPEHCRNVSAIPVTPQLAGRKGAIAQIVTAELAFLGLAARVLECGSLAGMPSVGIVSGASVSLDALSKAAGVADRGGLTAAGRHLAKHGGRPGSAFPATKGDPSRINRTAQDIVDDILTSPGATRSSRHTGRFGEVTEVGAPDGRGIRYRANGDFVGFLEP